MCLRLGSFVDIEPSGGHHLFSDTDPDGMLCPVCGWSLQRASAEVVFIIPLAARVKNIIRNRHLRESLRYQFTRRNHPAWIEDVYDGSLYRKFITTFGVTPDEPWVALAWKMSNDPVKINDTESYMPVLLTCMSLPPWIRVSWLGT